MNFANQAAGVASLGRGEDSALVHMAPKEVDALQQIARNNGGSLTINPETGLPEASFLKNILPAIAGIGLSMVPGIGPIAAGLLVGGGTALATKDIGRGLTAGLGAYGGAGLGGLFKGTLGTKAAIGAGAKTYGASPALTESVRAGAAPITGPVAASLPDKVAPGLAGLMNRQGLMYGAASLAPLAAGTMNPAPFRPVQSPEFNPYYGGPYKFQEGQVRFPTEEQLLDDDTSEFSYFDYKYPQRYQLLAEGGIIEAPKGRYLQGPGDGMSDDIPAIIRHEDGKEQPARLASGEFVIPADVVSHFGNGDSTAGAKKLYAMMDRVRKARTGTEKQGKEIDARKFLPA